MSNFLFLAFCCCCCCCALLGLGARDSLFAFCFPISDVSEIILSHFQFPKEFAEPLSLKRKNLLELFLYLRKVTDLLPVLSNFQKDEDKADGTRLLNQLQMLDNVLYHTSIANSSCSFKKKKCFRSNQFNASPSHLLQFKMEASRR